MLRKVLIANRGEIAIRVIRACRELGIASAAVYSEADRGALHVRLADEAHPCGAAPARDSYLQIDRLVEIARACGADAVHPGYGFLSENGDFADACEAAGLVFVGPPGDVIRAMGDKVTSRRAMQSAGVPIVPGATARLDDREVAAVCRELGYPVMVKASAGGGGKGLRLVCDPSELPQALERARSEAGASFGDDGLYVEKAIAAPRHVEVQVLADGRGAAVHLFERECSVQRRHQKLLEEAPACGLSDDLRARMGEAALRATRAVNYRGAGTVEFLLDGDDFYFLEMNTRIQVEHPVTEEVTGVDLVASMLRIAGGEPLSLRQEDLKLSGHALEARIYAEDPARGFLPSPGTIRDWRPPGGPGVRIESGVEAGSEVPVHYDPMVAKLVVSAPDRATALARLDRALAEFAVGGIRTTIPFHRWLLRQPAFVAGRYDTGLLAETLTGDLSLGTDPGAAQVARALAALVACELSAVGRRAACRVAQGKQAMRVELCLGEDGMLQVDAVGARQLLELHARSEAVWSVRDPQSGRQWEATVTRRGRKAVEVAIAGESFSWKVEAEEAS